MFGGLPCRFWPGSWRGPFQGGVDEDLSPLPPLLHAYEVIVMKKTFALQSPGKETQRVVEAVKNDVRKYVKRERRKPLPEGVDFWDFDCKVGISKNETTVRHLAEVTGAIDAIAAEGRTDVYVEILAKPGHRTKKPVEAVPGGEVVASPDLSPTDELTPGGNPKALIQQ